MKYLLLACVATVALAVPGGAIPAPSASTAATYTVFLGEQGPPSDPALRNVYGAVNQFLPSKLVIDAGARVTFSSTALHTVAYSPKPFPPFVPDPGKTTYDGLSDASGSPFYFDGLPKLIYNPQAFGPFGPKTISGKTPVSSGALSPRGPKAPPATATYTFPKAGTYRLYCALHPGMKATVVVKPAGTAVPKTPDQVRAQALLLQTKAFAKGAKLTKTKVAAKNTVAMGVGGPVTLFTYFPKTLKVKAGATVTFVNKSPSEVHDIVFGPKKYLEQWGKKTDFLPTGPKAPNQATPIIPYGTDPSPLTYDGASTHGNGFFATPLTAGAPGPLPRSSKVKFTKPGTYHYFCWIHGPDMSGTIVVTP
jgi:plastocyanin